ncbi:MAG: D-glycero-beta-D-manno-heptose-7-phosphate kinase [Acidimicrobiia bacterium]|nr:D-glycero-beta-D-manno-heptose-7-phosphate kinase [Acidimicrobiia bacterium]
MTLPPLEPRRARELIRALRGHRVLVIGDVMLDRFIVGRVTRISPEAPVPVVQFRSEFTRLGGAANVAHNLAALGAEVTLVGVVGSDAAAERLTRQLLESGVSAAELVTDPSRPTTEKVRIVTDHNQQVARVDYEQDAEVSGDVERELQQRIARAGSLAAVVLVSDYLKGAVTDRVMETARTRKDARAALIVDPKIPHLDRYAGATLITPNHHEAEAATLRQIRSHDDARDAAAAFRTRTRCEAVLITRGEHGMWLSTPDSEGAIAAVAREVSDVTGAGDTVAATLALALAAGASLAEAAILANQAAGIVVGKFGPATVLGDELLAGFPVSA